MLATPLTIAKAFSRVSEMEDTSYADEVYLLEAFHGPSWIWRLKTRFEAVASSATRLFRGFSTNSTTELPPYHPISSNSGLTGRAPRRLGDRARPVSALVGPTLFSGEASRVANTAWSSRRTHRW